MDNPRIVYLVRPAPAPAPAPAAPPQPPPPPEPVDHRRRQDVEEVAEAAEPEVIFLGELFNPPTPSPTGQSPLFIPPVNQQLFEQIMALDLPPLADDNNDDGDDNNEEQNPRVVDDGNGNDDNNGESSDRSEVIPMDEGSDLDYRLHDYDSFQDDEDEYSELGHPNDVDQQEDNHDDVQPRDNEFQELQDELREREQGQGHGQGHGQGQGQGQGQGHEDSDTEIDDQNDENYVPDDASRTTTTTTSQEIETVHFDDHQIAVRTEGSESSVSRDPEAEDPDSIVPKLVGVRNIRSLLNPLAEYNRLARRMSSKFVPSTSTIVANRVRRLLRKKFIIKPKMLFKFQRTEVIVFKNTKKKTTNPFPEQNLNPRGHCPLATPSFGYDPFDNPHHDYDYRPARGQFPPSSTISYHRQFEEQQGAGLSNVLIADPFMGSVGSSSSYLGSSSTSGHSTTRSVGYFPSLSAPFLGSSSSQVTVRPSALHSLATSTPPSVGTSSVGISSSMGISLPIPITAPRSSTQGTSTMGTSTMGTSTMGTSTMGTSTMGPSTQGTSTMGTSLPSPTGPRSSPMGTASHQVHLQPSSSSHHQSLGTVRPATPRSVGSSPSVGASFMGISSLGTPILRQPNPQSVGASIPIPTNVLQSSTMGSSSSQITIRHSAPRSLGTSTPPCVGSSSVCAYFSPSFMGSSSSYTLGTSIARHSTPPFMGSPTVGASSLGPSSFMGTSTALLPTPRSMGSASVGASSLGTPILRHSTLRSMGYSPSLGAASSMGSSSMGPSSFMGTSTPRHPTPRYMGPSPTLGASSMTIERQRTVDASSPVLVGMPIPSITVPRVSSLMGTPPSQVHLRPFRPHLGSSTTRR